MTKDSGTSLSAVLALIFAAAIAVAGWVSYYFAQQEADQLGKRNSQLELKLASEGTPEQEKLPATAAENQATPTASNTKPEPVAAAAPKAAPDAAEKKASVKTSSKPAGMETAKPTNIKTAASGGSKKAEPADPRTADATTSAGTGTTGGTATNAASTNKAETTGETAAPAPPKRYNRLIMAEREKAIKERDEAQARISAIMKQKRAAAQESLQLKEKLALASADVLKLEQKVKDVTAQMDQVKKKQQTRFDELRKTLEQELQQKQVTISQLKDRMTVVNVNAEILFNSGSVAIKPQGQKVLGLIASTLNQYPDRMISIEGHTDNVPVIANARFPTNWELSAARAAAAVRYLQEKAGVAAARMQAVGHGEFQPAVSNNSTEGRAINRRIEIILLPER